MKEFHLNVHYGYGTKSLSDGSDAMFANFAQLCVVGKKFPSDRTIKRELHRCGAATKRIRSLGYFCIHEETVE